MCQPHRPSSRKPKIKNSKRSSKTSTMALPKNVLGTELKSCCTAPMTGFYRDGYCRTGASDHGLHIVCTVMTAEFLEFSKSVGNDLSTPVPEWQFPGLNPGDQWCLCMLRWKEALEAGCPPKVVLESTHMSAIEFVSLDDMKANAIDWTE